MSERPEATSEAIAFETQGISRALRDFWASWEKTRLSDSKSGQSLLMLALPPLAQGIKEEQDRIAQGQRPRYWKEFVAVPADKLAFITLQAILDGYRGSKEDEKLTKYTLLAKRTGDWVRLEFEVNQELEADRIRQWVAAKHDRNASRAAKRFRPFLKSGWHGKRLAIQLGGVLLDLAVVSGAGMFRIYEKVHQPTRVRLTTKGLRTLAAYRHAAECSLRPKFLPKIGPPFPWNGNVGGGYRNFALSLVKRDEDIDVQEALKKADLSVVCEAVNAIQATPYRINQGMLAVLEAVAQRKGPSAVLPYMDICPMPPRLPKKKTSPEDWKRRQAERYRVGRLRRIAARNLIALDTRLSIARLLGTSDFYFPHQIDLRSRAYPIPQEVHPQADDMSRSLIEFARGEPLGERGGFWLAVHLANLYGHKVEKLPLEERFRWVKANEKKILDAAANPLGGERFWAEAEKKWRFLAAAFEWAGYVAEGPGYQSRLPIAMDGTCNGMQHLAALGRDSVGGAWTNLVPGEKPQDLYQEVAERLRTIVDREAPTDDAMAKLWKPVISRSLVKQATMTTPYGVTLSGMKKQIKSAILEDSGFRERFPDEKAAANYLAPLVNKAIGQVALKASEIRAWLRKIAKKLAKEDLGVSWTVPTGFPVVHEYREEKRRRIETVRGKVLVYEEDKTLRIRTRKQTNSIVPNLIHSLDAAHMMYTVRDLVARGVSDVAMVHDSYGVHARHVDLMNQTLREQFVRLYKEFSLSGFLEQVKAGAPGVRFTKRLSPPEPGALDLESVLRSTYFFS